MKRNIERNLKNWKNDKYRKPLILRGARQVGKTYSVMDFGNNNYENVVYLNFELNNDLCDIFKNTKDTSRILDQLRLITNEKIEENKTLIFFDEIQECGEALNTLKYFSEFNNDYHIIAAGSLLGIYLSNSSFPVRKVDFLDLYPMNFSEFLLALNLDNYVKIIEDFQNPDYFQNINLIHNDLVEKLKLFYAIGGMPEVVNKWVNEKNLDIVKKTQSAIINSYINDFSKHTDKFEANKISFVFSSLPSQLAKENKKFLYSTVRSGARAREYESALNWLIDANILYKVTDTKKALVPLKGFEEINFFKVFLLDTGLLINYVDIDPSNFINDDFVTMYNGAITENYVLSQLRKDFKMYYHTFGRYEIDFIIQYKNKIIPIEVKSTNNLESTSLKNFTKSYESDLAIKFSLKKIMKNENIFNIPLYLCEYLENILEIYMK